MNHWKHTFLLFVNDIIKQRVNGMHKLDDCKKEIGQKIERKSVLLLNEYETSPV